MKKKILNLLLVLGCVFVLVGCGKSNKISTLLNDYVKKEVDTWEEKGYAHTFTLSDIQTGLDKNYVIIASGDEKFTSSPSNTTYTEKVDNYYGITFSNTRMLEGNMSVFYCLVLDKNANKYYNIEITYKTKEINGIGKDYPYFGNEEEL